MQRPLELTAMEVLLLTDRVQNDDKDEGRIVAKPLLLKLGSAYLEMIGEKPREGTCTIWVTEPEAWLARTKFNSGDRCDADPKLGIHLLRKLYAILLAFDADVDRLPVAAADARDRRFVDEPTREFVADPDADLHNWDGLAGAAG